MSKFLDWFLGKDLQQPSPQQSDGAKALTISSPLYSTITNYGWPWSSYSALYRTQPAIRTVVHFIAHGIAGLNAKVYEKKGNDRPELTDHPLALLLHNPNPLTTRFSHTYATVADKCIFDRAYWRKHYERGVLKGVLRIPPPKIWPEYDKETGHVSYRTVTGEVLQRGRDLVVFSGYSPDGGDEGVPPLETLRRILAEDIAATTYRENFWKNQARPSGWVERPLDAPELSKEAAKRVREDVNSTWGGAQNAGKIPLLEEGMHYNPASFSARDSELTESRKFTYEEVTRVFGVPFALIGAMSESKSNVESFHRQLYQDVLGPWLRDLQDEIELQLLPEFEKQEARRHRIYVEYNLAEKLKGSFEEMSKSLVTSVGVPYMTANEARARLNLPSIDDEAFDIPVKPLNVMYGGQPAVTVPTEDPGTPPLAAVAALAEWASKHLPGEHDQDTHGGEGGEADDGIFSIGSTVVDSKGFKAETAQKMADQVAKLKKAYPTKNVNLDYVGSTTGAVPRKPHKRPKPSDLAKTDVSGTSAVVLIPSKHTRNLDQTVREQSDQGYLTPGSQDAAQMVAHEYGHVIQADLSYVDVMDRSRPMGDFGMQFKQDVEDAVRKATGVPESFGGRYREEDVEKGLSKYGASSFDELIAEAFAEYTTSPNPRPIAQAVGQVIDAHMKGPKSQAVKGPKSQAQTLRKMELARTYEKGLRKFFAFQEQSVVSKLGASKSNGQSSMEDIFGLKRWNSHLTYDLFAMAGHLQDDAVKLAERINDVTLIQLGKALPDQDDVRAVFTDAKDNRATAWACKLAGVDSLPITKGVVDDSQN